MRREFSPAVRAAARRRANGRCEKCRELLWKEGQYDHIIPAALGGDASLDNCCVLCATCHGHKTRKHDIPQIAKGNRIKSRWEMHRRRMAAKFGNI